jgi:heparosan-N-sulfate-glucuronate 5-epimerase
MMLARTPQLRAAFVAGDPHAGYYNDLRPFALGLARDPREATEALTRLSADRTRANPVTIAQLGLAAWQQVEIEAQWRDVVARTSDWLVSAMDDDGGIPYQFAMTHTYPVAAPWLSAMAQGEAASLLVRAARTLADPALEAAAARAGQALVDPRMGLIAETPEGPVLQEYPTQPPSHVLNGWIFGLWGLYDLAASLPRGGERFTGVFDAGVDALAARLEHYRVRPHWSRYDLFPHPIKHVASPFYHRLHIEQLLATNALAPRASIAQTAADWERGAQSSTSQGLALTRKVAFRLLRPRRTHRRSSP